MWNPEPQYRYLIFICEVAQARSYSRRRESADAKWRHVCRLPIMRRETQFKMADNKAGYITKKVQKQASRAKEKVRLLYFLLLRILNLSLIMAQLKKSPWTPRFSVSVDIALSSRAGAALSRGITWIFHVSPTVLRTHWIWNVSAQILYCYIASWK